MLKVMREKFKSLSFMLWIVIAAFILLIFVGWGVGTGKLGKQMKVIPLAKVGGSTISVEEFNRDWLRAMQMSKNKDMSDQEIKQQKAMLLEELINRKIILKKAQDAGLATKDNEVERTIIKMPVFQDGGKFVGTQEYINQLDNWKFTPQEFEEMIKDDITRQKLQQLLDSALVVPEESIRKEYIRRNEKAQIDYVAFSNDTYLPSIKISEKEALDYYDKHKDDYKYERRKTKYFMFSPDDFRNKVRIKDKDIIDYYYDESSGAYEEKRRASQIFFKFPPDADEEKMKELETKAGNVYQEIKKGADFAEMAEKYFEDQATAAQGGDLGIFTTGKYPDLDETIFSMKEGDVSEPVMSSSGYHIIKLTGIQPETPVEQVTDEIKNILTQKKAAELAGNAANDAALKYSAAKNMDAIAEEYGLTAKETDFFKKEDALIPGIPGNTSSLAQKVFSLKEKGEMTDAPAPVGNSFLVAQYVDSEGPIVPPFAEVKDMVEKAVMNEKARALAAQKAEEFLQTLKKPDMSLEKAAEAHKLEVKTSNEFSRMQPISDIGFVREVSESAFQMKEGDVSPIVRYPKGELIFRLKKKFHFDPEHYKQERASIRKNLTDMESNFFFASFMTNARTNMEKNKLIEKNEDQVRKQVER